MAFELLYGANGESYSIYSDDDFLALVKELMGRDAEEKVAKYMRFSDRKDLLDELSFVKQDLSDADKVISRVQANVSSLSDLLKTEELSIKTLKSYIKAIESALNDI